MKKIIMFLACFLSFSIANAREIRIDFDVKFNSMYDFTSESWRPTNMLGGEASIIVDLDEPQLWGKYYWESTLQQIGTQFGRTVIQSPILENIYY